MTDITNKYNFHAYHLTDTWKLKDIDRIFGSSSLMQSATKLIYRDGENRYFFVYRFGSIVFFNIDQEHRLELLSKIKTVIADDKQVQPTSEDLAVQIQSNEKENVGFEFAVLNDLSIEKIELLAFVLAQSTALEFFEMNMDSLLRQTDTIGADLKKRGRLSGRSSKIKKFIGECITTKHDLVASLYLLDKPEETWNNQFLDFLYKDAADMFEIRERYRTLDYKLKIVQENLELISELLQYKNANILESAIILLIVVEIILFVLQIFYFKQ